MTHLTTFQRLTEIVEELRQECPWDRRQTKESLRHLTIEETYELADAVLKDDYREIKAELGDLLLHVLFYSSLAAEKGQFTLAEMIQGQIDKLIRRHPHVYGDLRGATEEQVRQNWEQIKAKERENAGKKESSALDGVPESLPSLIKAQRMQEKAALVGFDWKNKEQVWAKVEEEIAEVHAAETPDALEDEMGDLFFALINYCRFVGANAEDALARTSRKFQYRFNHIERRAREIGKPLTAMSLEEMDGYWEEAKGFPS
ncbi:MAG: nucleoside triphosphate pyrophosphohydrolase [Bacteroidia bacterium]|nr:nucleoside triphosphate pyrophosphohydrolase [Bacteroidia bacterium]